MSVIIVTRIVLIPLVLVLVLILPFSLLTLAARPLLRVLLIAVRLMMSTTTAVTSRTLGFGLGLLDLVGDVTILPH